MSTAGDSAGVQIVEALRPLWNDEPAWTIDPDPLVDLAVSGSGPNHEFHQVIGMSRLADGSLVLVDRGWSEIRRYSAEGGFLNSTGREGEGPGEYQQIELMEHAQGDTLRGPLERRAPFRESLAGCHGRWSHLPG